MINMEPTAQHLIHLRQLLHANPELSGYEENTAAYITGFLKKLNPDEIMTGIGGHGILVLFDSCKPGPTLLFRSELDALPIYEINDFPHRSVVDGVSHTCGHDGHTTILCGLAEKLAAEKPASGKVYLLFQPAEETGEGAAKVVADKKFYINPDFVFALHNLPGFEAGHIVVRDGLFSAAVNSIIIKLKGKTAHAAEPEFGINPASAISEIIAFADQLNNNHPEEANFQLVTPVHINMGTAAYGVSAGDAELHYTLRCWDNDKLRNLETALINRSTEIAAGSGLQLAHAFTQTFYANDNNKEANDVVRASAQQNGFILEEKIVPFKWAEDFGYFTSQFKGCMFGLGAGTGHPALHNPDYDFPDDITATGIQIFHSITKNILPA
ncbi:MAG: amidohydrolase [Chitinophagaceae bacterium]|nr:amidohydrolase [Chitinophagaceae bacterium]